MLPEGCAGFVYDSDYQRFFLVMAVGVVSGSWSLQASALSEQTGADLILEEAKGIFGPIPEELRAAF